MPTQTITRVLLSEGPIEGGGETAIAELPPGYEGPCQVIAACDRKVIAVLPNTEEATRIASAAIIHHIGGYGSVYVRPATADAVQYQDLEDWLLN